MPTVHLLALGSRGDVVPVLALAATMQSRGRRVLVHGPTSYAASSTAAGVPYRGVGDRRLLGQTPAGRRVVLANVALTYLHLRSIYRAWSRQVWAGLGDVAAPEDVLLCGLGSAALARSWQRMGRRAGLVLLADVAPAPLRGTAGGLPGRARRRLTWTMAADMSSAPLPARVAAASEGVLPTVLAVSDTLNPGPHPDAADVVSTGHLISPGRRLDTATPAGLGSDGRPLVYVGLGSMGDPQGRTLAMFDAAAADVGCRLVTDASPAADRLEHTTVTGPVDHHALFPHVTGALHHGGAGTTIAGLLAGRPTGSIPHLGDQFATARTVHALGAGPRPLHRHRLTARNVRRTLELLADPPRAHVTSAAVLADRLAAEDGLQRTAVACERLCDGLPLRAT